MSKYLGIMIETSENLKLTDELVTLSYLMSCVLSSLEVEYLPIVCFIEEKKDITWQELYSTLLTFENTLAR